MERLSISLPEKLSRDFDGFIAKRGYDNRSEALRDLIRASLVEEEWSVNARVVGVISVVFDHHQRKLQEKLTNIQHDFERMVIATTHVHLDHDNCLEVIIATGKAKRIRTLVNRIQSVRGVKSASLTTSSTGRAIA